MTTGFGLVQIAPPGPGGVADHMDALADTWDRLGVGSARLRLQEDDLREQPLAERLVAASGGRPRIAVLLHFSCYGYARRGLCTWLVDALAQARRELGGRLVLVTMFHELHASGPPWRSAFWLGGFQARIARDLARASDVLWTNAAAHAGWLADRAATHVPIHVAPVFSTIGELPGDAPPSARPSTMVVFGGRATRDRALRALAGRGNALAVLGVWELLEIGSGSPCDVPPGLPPCRHAGALPAAEVNTALAWARFGLIDYPGTLLAKSSVFGAYAAAGCVVLNTREDAEPADGLMAGTHYLALHRLGLTAGTVLDQIGAAARAWYAPHALETQARDHLRLIGRRIARTEECA